MIPIFSFKKPLISNLLECAGVIFPGIELAVGAFYNTEQKEMVCYEKTSLTATPFEIGNNKYDIDFNYERKQTEGYKWLNNMVLSNFDKKNTKLSLFDEVNNNVLLLKIRNEYDKQCDILVLLLNKNMPIFNIEKNRADITTREKNMIGEITYNNIIMLKKTLHNDILVYNAFRESFSQTKLNAYKIEQELKEAQSNYSQSIIEYCKHQLSIISKEIPGNVTLSEGAIEKLAHYKGKFESLKTILSNAVTVAINSTYGLTNITIIIEKEHIMLNTTFLDKRVPPEFTTLKHNRYTRTIQLLDKYEEAANQVKNKGLKITGSNVGMHCSPSVSAPAISDAIVNHQKKILTLFNEYPEKWGTIRANFRPIVNALNKNLHFAKTKQELYIK